MKLLSIILPIYNVEAYLERCILSLLNQGIPLKDYEIICINDGSPDNSKDVVLKLQEQYPNVILINQTNRGVCVARNKGLEYASGKYVLFVDPDDFVKSNTLSKLIKICISYKTQILVPGYQFVDSDGVIVGDKVLELEDNVIYDGLTTYFLLREEKHLIEDSSVGIIFETKFLKSNNLNYLPNIIINEDAELLARVHSLATKCMITDLVFYIAAAREESVTRSNKFGKNYVRNGFIKAALNLINFRNQRKLNSKQKIFLNGPIVQFVFLSLSSALNSRSFKVLNSTVKMLKDSGLSKLEIEGCNGDRLIFGRMFNLSPYFGTLAIILIHKVFNRSSVTTF